ncbi:hypothetical protein [Nocardia brasiliensis]|uniref:hypothetical protein n=1 Tax=Nocardia brasiliensis TaxID=37326 RepID=UPI00366B57F9
MPQLALNQETLCGIAVEQRIPVVIGVHVFGHDELDALRRGRFRAAAGLSWLVTPFEHAQL